MEDKINANIFYSNCTIKDFTLPDELSFFKSEIMELFHIDQQLYNQIIISYIHKQNDKEKLIEIKTENDYNDIKQKINEIKDKTILIEVQKDTKKIDSKIPSAFEEEIQMVVEREIRMAGERIRNYLSSNNKNNNELKKRDKTCDDCKELITGDIYKNAINVEEKYYCEKCAFKINDPMFIVH